MPVTGRTGLPRSGKSYSALKLDVIPALRQGRKVVTNLPIDKQKLVRLGHISPEQADLLTIYTGEELADSFFYEIDRITGDEDAAHVGALVVYDEMQREFGSKDWSKNPRRDGLRDWLSHHGHLGCDLVWISQSEALVDVVVLRMTELVMFTRSKRAMALARPLSFVTYTYFCVEGIVQTKQPANEQHDRVEMRYAACYKSFQVAGAGANLKPMIPKPAKVAIAGAGLLFLVAIYGGWATWADLFSGGKSSGSPLTVPVPSVPRAASPAASSPVPPPKPTPTREVPYDGHFQDSDGSWLVLCGGDVVGRMESTADPFIGGSSPAGSVAYARVGYCNGGDTRTGGGSGVPSMPPTMVSSANE